MRGLVKAAWVWMLVGAGAAAQETAPPTLPPSLTPSLPNAEQIRPFSGRPVLVKRAFCHAEGLPDAAAAMYLEDTGPLTYQIVRLEYNDQGKAMLQTGKNAAKVQTYYQRYIADGQPTNKLVFGALLGAWQLFGLKFSWEDTEYHCRVSG